MVIRASCIFYKINHYFAFYILHIDIPNSDFKFNKLFIPFRQEQNMLGWKNWQTQQYSTYERKENLVKFQDLICLVYFVVSTARLLISEKVASKSLLLHVYANIVVNSKYFITNKQIKILLKIILQISVWH